MSVFWFFELSIWSLPTAGIVPSKQSSEKGNVCVYEWTVCGKLPSKEQQLSRTQHYSRLTCNHVLFTHNTARAEYRWPLRHDDRIISYQHIHVARACSSMFYVILSATNTETGESIISKRLLTLNITSTKDVDTSVTTNSPSTNILPQVATCK